MSIEARTRVLVLPTVVALTLVLLLVGAVGARAGAPDGEVEAAPVAGVTHTVLTGDTLWDIASDHVAPGDDVRVLIEKIKAANGLEDSIIRPGQVLLVPASG
ncbi:MAG: LysM peptidoglycan-binding domain-containing protein [Acidimicrobiia bacterium]|nr:MAG: LysM peptidoglycan-binding domain-containing protein [Acidimicrobiia bacterium]